MSKEAIGAGLGILGMLKQDQRTREANQQERAMMDLQYQNQRKLNQQGHDLQYDMWNKTNYGAQVDHLKDAGLSVGLMYGQSGAGGTTTGSQGGGSAAKGSSKQPMDIGASLQAAMLASQIEVNKATAKEKNANATSTLGEGGVGAAQIESLAAGVKNTQAQQKLTEAETEYQNILNFIKDSTSLNDIAIVEGNLMKVYAEAESAKQIARSDKANADVDVATIDERIDLAEKAAIQAGLNITLTEANIRLTNAQTKKVGEQIYEIWRNLSMRKYMNETERMNALTAQARLALERELGEGNLTMREWEFASKSLEGIVGKFKPRHTVKRTSQKGANGRYKRTTERTKEW